LSDNIYYWQVRACDTTDNCSDWSGPWQVTIDGTAPQVNAGTDKIVKSAVNQDATASDNLSGIFSLSWTQTSGPVAGVINFLTPNFEDTIISANIDGLYTIRLTVTDFAGNISFDEAVINWDTTIPATPSWISPVDGAMTKITNSIFFRWNTVIDNGSGIAGYEFEITGPNGYFINTKIACGNLLISPTQTQIPNSLIGPGAICLDGDYVLLPNSGADPNSPGGGDGIYTRRVRAYDNAGNASNWSTATIIRDTQRPVSVIQNVSPLFNGIYSNTRTLNFNVNVNDALSGVKSVTIYTFILGFPLPVGTCTNFASCTITALPSDGTYLFYSSAEDFADDLTAADVYLANNGDDGKGNIEIKNTAEISVIVDTDPPEATITSHSDGQTVKGNQTISGAVFDPNLWRYNFIVVNSSNIVVAGPGTVNNDGPSAFPSFPWNTASFPDGNYIIKLEARDKATNKDCGTLPCSEPVTNDPNNPADSIDWVNLTVDNTPPTTSVFIQGQLDNNSPSYPPLIRTDNNGWNGFGWYEIFNFVRLDIASGNSSDLIKFNLVNGNANCPAVNSATYTSVINATDISALVNALGEGAHKLCYFGYDQVNNIEAGAPRQLLFKLDNTSPAFSITNVSGILVNGVYYNNNSTEIVRISITDNLAGYRLTRYELYDASCLNFASINEDIFNTNITALNNTSRTLTLTNLADGSYCLRIQVFDDVQNKSAIQNVFFVIDTQSPNPPEWLQTPIYTRVGGIGGTQNLPLDFTESTSTDIAAYELQSVAVNLDNTNKQTFLGLISPGNCIITDNNIETCNFDVSTGSDIRLIYRLRSVDRSGNTSLWTNWSNNGGDPLSTVDFANFNGENFTYSDYLNRSDAFASAKGYAINENGGLAIREAVNPLSNITTILPQPYFTNNTPVSLDYEVSDTDTGIVLVNLAYTYNGIDQGIYLTQSYTGEININSQSAVYQPFSFDFPNGDGAYCFYTISEDIANNLPLDSGLGNIESVKSCQLEINFDQTSPIINQITDTLFNEGDPIPRQDTTFDIVAQRAQEDIDKLCYSINGTLERCIPDNGTHTWNIWDFEAIPIELPGVWWGLDYFDTSVLPEDIYTIQYYVIDLAQNKSDVFNTAITIANDPPLVNLHIQNPEPLFEGDTVLFSGSFTDPSCSPNATLPCLNVLGNVPDDSDWLLNIDYGDGVKLNLGSVSVPKQIIIPDHAYFEEVNYIVVLTVKESEPAILNSHLPAFATGKGEGKSGSKSITVSIANNAPVVSISADPSTFVNSGTNVTLKANVTLGNLPYAYSWYGNCYGNSDRYILPRRAGVYNCGILVVDSDGDFATAEIQVVVNKLPVTISETITESNNILGEKENLLQLCTQKSKISGYVFRDSNNNGFMDINEIGVKDVQIKITATIDNEDKVIILLRSSFDGYYEYVICPGNYRIEINQETVPAGYKTVNDNVINIVIAENEDLIDLNFAISEITLPVNYLIFLIPLLILGSIAFLIRIITRRNKGYTVEYS
ncbi:MAG TPA: SdrD B-like domain-containing protein, partial [Candidatus Dojkabacteria bacterium]|nr:SdrD B-like domain-containing protein [Candidatus Dojkabacteria bacterium]